MSTSQGRIATTSCGRAPQRCCSWTIAATWGDRWGRIAPKKMIAAMVSDLSSDFGGAGPDTETRPVAIAAVPITPSGPCSSGSA